MSSTQNAILRVGSGWFKTRALCDATEISELEKSRLMQENIN